MRTDPHASVRSAACRYLLRLVAGAALALCPSGILQGQPAPAAPRPPTISVSGSTVAEGEAGATTPATFVVTLSAPWTRPISVQYATRDGSAIAAAGDYRRTAGTLKFDPGLTSATVEVAIRGDGVEEADEQLFLVLSRPVGAEIAVAQAAVEIVDDDGAAGPGVGPELSIRDARVSEGDGGRLQARFEVTLSDAAPTAVTVVFTTADGSAVAGEDYEASSGQLRFPAGATTRVLPVTILGDSVREGDEDFVVELSEPLGAALAAGVGRGLILDDDGAGAMSLEPMGSLERTGRPGQTVVLLVRVRAAAGGTVAGAAIQWSLDGDGELLDGTSTTTDSAGVARQRLRLAGGPGRSAVRVEAPGSDRVVLFQVGVGAAPGG